MARSTYQTFLMEGTADAETGDVTYAQIKAGDAVVDIKDFPDLFPTPEQIETTTLANKRRTYIAGIEEGGTIAFTTNYDRDQFIDFQQKKDTERKLAIWFGATVDGTTGVLTPTGAYGKIIFSGMLVPSMGGKGVNEVIETTLNLFITGDMYMDETVAP